MALIEWRDDFATGTASVDYEHQLLISLINSAYKQLGNQPPRDGMIAFIEITYNAFASHFEVEEDVMRRHDYDQLDAHHADHQRLLQELQAIRVSLSNAGPFDPEALRDTLTDWFMVHFSAHDARLHKVHSH